MANESLSLSQLSDVTQQATSFMVSIWFAVAEFYQEAVASAKATKEALIYSDLQLFGQYRSINCALKVS